ncbi:nascent polypeptide-associated complex subunit alpha, muscle-specific form-like [Ornithodoros turicata]|uniref:nascent polypeptide-associated complex subunit alpha, muscle-specific form-like n=1 Tax=Ornithodoros turicata TaxID=34597 RepID=UPI00313A27E8
MPKQPDQDPTNPYFLFPYRSETEVIEICESPLQSLLNRLPVSLFAPEAIASSSSDVGATPANSPRSPPFVRPIQKPPKKSTQVQTDDRFIDGSPRFQTTACQASIPEPAAASQPPSTEAPVRQGSCCCCSSESCVASCHSLGRSGSREWYESSRQQYDLQAMLQDMALRNLALQNAALAAAYRNYAAPQIYSCPTASSYSYWFYPNYPLYPPYNAWLAMYQMAQYLQQQYALSYWQDQWYNRSSSESLPEPQDDEPKKVKRIFTRLDDGARRRRGIRALPAPQSSECSLCGGVCRLFGEGGRHRRDHRREQGPRAAVSKSHAGSRRVTSATEYASPQGDKARFNHKRPKSRIDANNAMNGDTAGRAIPSIEQTRVLQDTARVERSAVKPDIVQPCEDQTAPTMVQEKSSNVAQAAAVSGLSGTAAVNMALPDASRSISPSGGKVQQMVITPPGVRSPAANDAPGGGAVQQLPVVSENASGQPPIPEAGLVPTDKSASGAPNGQGAKSITSPTEVPKGAAGGDNKSQNGDEVLELNPIAKVITPIGSPTNAAKAMAQEIYSLKTLTAEAGSLSPLGTPEKKGICNVQPAGDQGMMEANASPSQSTKTAKAMTQEIDSLKALTTVAGSLSPIGSPERKELCNVGPAGVQGMPEATASPSQSTKVVKVMAQEIDSLKTLTDEAGSPSPIGSPERKELCNVRPAVDQGMLEANANASQKQSPEGGVSSAEGAASPNTIVPVPEGSLPVGAGEAPGGNASMAPVQPASEGMPPVNHGSAASPEAIMSAEEQGVPQNTGGDNNAVQPQVTAEEHIVNVDPGNANGSVPAAPAGGDTNKQESKVDDKGGSGGSSSTSSDSGGNVAYSGKANLVFFAAAAVVLLIIIVAVILFSGSGKSGKKTKKLVLVQGTTHFIDVIDNATSYERKVVDETTSQTANLLDI